MKGKKIVIFAVDDDLGDLELFSRALEDIPGWEIEFNPFSRWNDCLYEVKRRPMDILFLDYYLGATTAIEIISSLRINGEKRPIIALTGKGNEKIAAEVSRAGADDYLIKDELTPDSLRRAISNAIERFKAAEEKSHLEKRLQKAQKLETLGTLAGGIAHDFNNILFPIVGLSELLLEDLTPGTPEWENVKEIETAGKRGAELVKQILAFSRQSDHQLSAIRFQSVMEEVLKLIRSSIPKNIEIIQTLQNDCGLVLSDSIQLHQIGMNLITNAYHAVQENCGKIHVDLREIEVNQRLNDVGLTPGKYATLTVSDTGTGIQEEHLEKIFEPYFTTKEKGKGTGLGLSAVYGIVKEHKGEIKVTSEPGKGTTFQVYIPVMVSSVTEEGAWKGFQSPPLPTGMEHILVVDDEISIAKLEKKMLERLGYTVLERTSSMDALETFKTNPDTYDLVISDMSMPQMTGKRLAEELLKIRPDIPIIICTGFSERFNQDKASIMGIKGLLMKPVMKTELAKEVRRVLDEIKVHSY